MAALETDGSVEGLKVGLLTGKFRKLTRPDVWDSIVRVRETLAALGAHVEEVDGSDGDDLGVCMQDMMMAEAVAFHRQRLHEQPEIFGAEYSRACAPAPRLLVCNMLPRAKCSAYGDATSAFSKSIRCCWRQLARCPRQPSPKRTVSKQPNWSARLRMASACWACRC